MPKSTKEEKFRWIKPILDKEINIKNVERSYREDQEKFYETSKFGGLRELETKIKIWNNDSNNLEHCGLNGLSPNEFLRLSEAQNVCG